jgi:hypothetical protein
MGLSSEQIAQRPRERSFRVYNVGIAKTGTQSVAGIFSNYRTLHEYLFPDTVEAVGRRASGQMSESQFREFLHWRDGVARLDVDSSSYNSFYVDRLAEEFVDAKFIFVIRDCWSWLDSMLNMAVRLGPHMPGWMVEHCRTILGPCFSGDDEEQLSERLPALVDGGLSYWARANQFVVDALPSERSIVLRTGELSESLPRLAAFVGVPVESLRADLSHVHRAEQRYNLLQAVDPRVLEKHYAADCGQLMERYFPEVEVAA